MKGDALDPRALIREAFQIDGIVIEQCRGIFLDWALGVPDGADTQALIGQLLVQYMDEPMDHPMTIVLQEGMKSGQPNTKRRGGWRSRVL